MAGRQSEPSIDEILSSIRKVIAEDDAADNSPRNISAKSIASEIASAKITSGHVADRKSAVKDDILELTSQDSDDSEPLVNQETAQGLRHGLSALAALSEPSARPQIVRSGETSLESLVTEMLRPMMKDWLDQNLPELVEMMVAKEIQRITKKG